MQEPKRLQTNTNFVRLSEPYLLSYFLMRYHFIILKSIFSKFSILIDLSFSVILI